MGATNLSTTITAKTEKQLDKKFTAMCEEDLWTYGNDPYSGSWATKLDHGVRVVSSPIDLPKRVTQKWRDENTLKLWDYLENKADKWGPALAVKITSSEYLVSCWAPE